MKILIIIILIVIAAIASAAMDTIAFHQGGWLKRRFGKFFDITIQGRRVPFTKYHLDGFHLSKSLMICSYVGAISVFLPHVILSFIAIGLLYIIIFNLFFNKIFK